MRFNLYVLYLHTTNIFFVMKQPTTENSDIIKLVAILGDFALLNLSMILVFFILKGIDSQAIAHISLKTYLLTSNLCYIPCISIFGVILHNRIVRPEQIVGRLLGTISLHVVIFLTVLAIIKVDNFSRIYLLAFYLSFIPLAIGWRTDIAVLCENVPPQWQEPAHHCTDRRRGQYGGAVPYVERFDLRIQGF